MQVIVCSRTLVTSVTCDLYCICLMLKQLRGSRLITMQVIVCSHTLATRVTLHVICTVFVSQVEVGILQAKVGIQAKVGKVGIRVAVLQRFQRFSNVKDVRSGRASCQRNLCGHWGRMLKQFRGSRLITMQVIVCSRTLATRVTLHVICTVFVSC